MANPTLSAAQRTPLEVLLERIFGEDQAKGIEHLAKTFDSEFNQALGKRNIQSSPYCAIVPQISPLKGGIRQFDDAVKIALVRLLHLLADARERPSGLSAQSAPVTGGFTWEELQSYFMQASFLEPVDDKQPVPKSLQTAGKRKICWFRRYTELGIPKSRAIFELLGVIIDKKEDTRVLGDRDIDIGPLSALLSGRSESETSAYHHRGDRRKQRPGRGLSIDSAVSAVFKKGGRASNPGRAQSLDSTLVGRQEGSSLYQRMAVLAEPAPTMQEEPEALGEDKLPGAHNLNTSSSQKYALTWNTSQTPSSWTALELIALKFPSSPEDSNFTISRLTVTAWTSFDHRLILPRSQTVVRIESLCRQFRARIDFIKLLPEGRRKEAINEAESLFGA